MIESVGVIEVTSIGLGLAAQDAMLKAADVQLLLARTICAGKYIVVVAGRVADVTAAVDAGRDALPDGLIDHGVIAKIHPAVFRALGQSVELHVAVGSSPAERPGALGVVETYSATSVLGAADAAAKCANVTLLKIHLAMALGGKGYVLLAGSVSDVQAAVAAGAEVARAKGLLVSAVAIAGPSPELYEEFA